MLINNISYQHIIFHENLSKIQGKEHKNEIKNIILSFMSIALKKKMHRLSSLQFYNIYLRVGIDKV